MALSTPLSRYDFLLDGKEVRDNVTGLIWKRCPEGRAWNGTVCTGIAAQYTSQSFRRLLKRCQIKASMSGVGACWDNAVVERFFGSLKYEWLLKVCSFTDVLPEQAIKVCSIVIREVTIRAGSTDNYCDVFK